MKKLSRADRKQIEAAIARANRTDRKEKSAQDSIPYERMWPDGICRVAGSHYTKTIQFQDINYQLSQNEDKTAIFEGWCDFLNYFDSSIQFQLSFLNLAASEETFARAINMQRFHSAGVMRSKRFADSSGAIHVRYRLSSFTTHAVPHVVFLYAINRSHASESRIRSVSPDSNHSSALRSASSLPLRPGLDDTNVFRSPSSPVTLICHR